jgi:hypothetical protein
MLRRYAAAAFLILLCLVSSEAVAKIMFMFNPPNVTYSTETTRSQYRLIDSRKSNAVETTTGADHSLTATATGYAISTTPTVFMARQNGEVVDNVAAEVLGSVPYVLKLDFDGNAIEATGFDRLPMMVDSALDSTTAAAVMKRVDLGQMAQFPVSEWNGRNGFRSTSEAGVGEMIYDQSDYELPGGPKVIFFTAKQIIDTSRIDGQLCARLIISADSNPDSLAATLGLPIEKIKEAYALTDDQRARAGSNEIRLHSRVELVWEILTGLMRSEKVNRHVARTVTRAGATGRMETVEEEATVYTYPTRK